MKLLNLIVLAVASSASATPVDGTEADAGAQATTGVTFYEHINFGGFSYEIPSTGRCWALPTTLYQKVSSVRFRKSGISCALFRNRQCFPPVLYAGLRESVSDFHRLGLGDQVGSVYCGLTNDEDDD